MFTCEIDLFFCAAHRLMNHPGKCASLHGHTYGVRVGVEVDHLHADTSIGVDFGVMRRAFTSTLELFDHKSLLWINDPLVVALCGQSVRSAATFGPDDSHVLLSAKEELGGRTIVAMRKHPSSEAIAMMLFALFEMDLKGTATISWVEVSESQTTRARYSRG